VGAHPDHIAGIERQMPGHRADEGRDAEQHVVRAELGRCLTIQADSGLEGIQIHVRLDPRPHRLERVGVLGAPEGPIRSLPGALGDVIANRVSEDAGKRVRLAQVLGLLPDDSDEFPLVVHLLGRVTRDYDILFVRDESVHGTVADFRTIRQNCRFSAFRRPLQYVGGIVAPDAIEGPRNYGNLDLDVAERVCTSAALEPGEGISRNLLDMISFENPVYGPVSVRKSHPAHRSSFTRAARAFSTDRTIKCPRGRSSAGRSATLLCANRRPCRGGAHGWCGCFRCLRGEKGLPERFRNRDARQACSRSPRRCLRPLRDVRTYWSEDDGFAVSANAATSPPGAPDGREAPFLADARPRSGASGPPSFRNQIRRDT